MIIVAIEVAAKLIASDEKRAMNSAISTNIL